MLRICLGAISKRLYSTEASGPRYIITRTDASGSLPVYLDVKNGGTRSLTIIRRVQGDAEALRQEVAALFPDTSKNFVTVNPINNQVIIKGAYVNDIKQWLAQKGI
ncbi:54S ribosomal protein img2 [Umbelopsis nana]